MNDETIVKILLQGSYVTEEDVELARKYAIEREASMVDYLFTKGLISKEILGQAVAEQFNVSFIDLEKERIDEDVLQIVPELVARSKRVIAFAMDDDHLKLGMNIPENLEIRHLLEKKTSRIVIPYYITDQDFENALKLYRGTLKDEMEGILEKMKDIDISREERDEMIVKIVNVLFEYAYQNKASDVHIEPYQDEVMIRFRIDGVMHEVLELPKELHSLILSRIKILARMRTDEHNAAQDGKIRFQSGKDRIDVRVSIVPIVGGENVVMRLLAAKARQFDLASLGFNPVYLKRIKAIIRKPHGMILVTGPTGSGKSTTLYSFLKILNRKEVHISTIEDPVEYDIEGVSQIQVNPATNLTFAKGLRAIVRQDPDIIMVGEIRDSETAGIAINSALTGHLVLSTLHTNDAATTLPRLIDMDIEPFLVSSTVNAIIAQRLVRKICEKCRKSVYVDVADLKNQISERLIKKIIKKQKQVRFYHSEGCKSCGNTGYKGRVGIFEMLEMTEEIKALVSKRATSDEIMKIAIKDGMETMLEDGINKAMNGLTTIDEVLRVTKE
ncbi:MAG: GspE/PulE family protein [Candidatus Magasanikbacteria bacterium]|nr:GspE/PulE family protein [Candidatus Magasanikbacteria bacterium]